MKPQKLPNDSEPAFRAMLSSLDNVVEKQNVVPRVADRVRDIQALVGDDLLWVEETLRQASQGPEPGSAAAKHLLTRGGKRVRPVALLLSAACFGKVSPAARQLAVVAELVHSATLLHDDVIDEGMERRGALTSRRIWGNAVSVLGGDLLLVAALERTHEHAPALMSELLSTLRKLVEGEIVQLRGRSVLDVTEATYECILRGKTASLFAWACFVGANLGGAEPHEQEQFRRFGENLGMAFQLVDDVLDYTGANTGKSLLSDLREGKLTLPLVLTVGARPDLLPLLERVREGDESSVPFLSNAVIESGACAEVRARARAYTAAAVAELGVARVGKARALLASVAEELAARVT